MKLEDLIVEKSTYFQSAGLVVGSAPSIKMLKKNIFDGIKIGVGDVPWRAQNLGPFNYWVCANTYFPIPWEPKHRKAIDDTKCKILIATNVVNNYQENLEGVLSKLEELNRESKFIFFDQKHFGNKNCKPEAPCCKFYSKLNFQTTIQETINQMFQESDGPAYSIGLTVAIHGYALAILFRLNPIYLIGIELPEKLADYKAYRNWKMPVEKFRSKMKRLVLQNIPFMPQRNIDFTGRREEMLEDFRRLSEIASKLGIETISLSKTSPLNQIDKIKFEKTFRHKLKS